MKQGTSQYLPQFGIASLLGFVAGQAVRDVYLGHLFGDLGLFEVASLTFGTAAAVFGLFLVVIQPEQIALIIRGWRTMLLLNATTAAAWLSYFEALRIGQPAAVNLAFSGVAPVAVTLFGMAGLRNAVEYRSGVLAHAVHIAIVGSVAALAFVAEPLAIAFAVFAGVAITAETILAKRMNDGGVTALAIVGTRFLLVTVIAVVMLGQSQEPFAGMLFSDVAWQAAIFLVILILPIYFAQTGIALTSPMVAGVICALGPIATLGLQSMAGAIRLTPAMLNITLAYTALAIVAAGLAASAQLRVSTGTGDAQATSAQA
jgi:drug/metabolite transporter (DMT)-like permease